MIVFAILLTVYAHKCSQSDDIINMNFRKADFLLCKMLLKNI